MNSEWAAVLELLQLLLLDARTGVLLGVLLVAAVFDTKSHRIPNWLVLSGLAYGLVYNAVVDSYPEGLGLLPALAGMGVGLAMLLPAYLLRAMGAGDVKLMAMAGAFLGPWHVFLAALAAMLAGGALAIGYGLATSRLGRMLGNVAALGRGAVLDLAVGDRPDLGGAGMASAGKLPYGLAIALGTAGYLVMKQLGLVQLAYLF